MASQRSPTIIIDNGSGFVKAGFSGDKQFPTVTLPCGDVLVGQFVLDVEQEGKLPTVNVDCLKEMWKDSINKLKADSTEHNFVLTENVFYDEKQRKAMAEVIFEEFEAPGLYIDHESSLSLMWYRKTTGVVVDCGELMTSVVVYYNGRRVNDNVLNFGGRDVTLKLLSSLEKNGYEQLNLQNHGHRMEIRKIKNQYGRVSTHYEREMHLAGKSEPISAPCRLVPQKVLLMRNEPFSCSEGLFHPHHFDKRPRGIHHAVCRAIESQPTEKQAALYESILLCGGTTLLKSFSERLSTEIKNVMKVNTPVKVIATKGREHSVWLGANELMSKEGYTSQLMVNKSNYRESGERILRRKQDIASFLYFSNRMSCLDVV